jgi:hypothetical protein
MPNGGLDNCGNCPHFDWKTNHCHLRDIDIEEPKWTTCDDCGKDTDEAHGPVIDIIVRREGIKGSYERVAREEV